ncbi:MAG: SDR family oxidoreductase, partial [Mesorhizobium sp.]
GYRVAFFSHQPERVQAAARALSASYGAERIRSAVVDLRDPEAVRRFFDELAAHWPAPSVLVCNAGYSPKR